MWHAGGSQRQRCHVTSPQLSLVPAKYCAAHISQAGGVGWAVVDQIRSFRCRIVVSRNITSGRQALELGSLAMKICRNDNALSDFSEGLQREAAGRARRRSCHPTQPSPGLPYWRSRAQLAAGAAVQRTIQPRAAYLRRRRASRAPSALSANSSGRSVNLTRGWRSAPRRYPQSKGYRDVDHRRR